MIFTDGVSTLMVIDGYPSMTVSTLMVIDGYPSLTKCYHCSGLTFTDGASPLTVTDG